MCVPARDMGVPKVLILDWDVSGYGFRVKVVFRVRVTGSGRGVVAGYCLCLGQGYSVTNGAVNDRSGLRLCLGLSEIDMTLTTTPIYATPPLPGLHQALYYPDPGAKMPKKIQVN